MRSKIGWLAKKSPFLLGGVLSFSPVSLAQSEENQQLTQSEERTERIQVTGSRIKRIDFEGSSPVTVISREEIEQSGVTSVADLLRRTNASPLGNFTGSGGFVRSGAATVNLLGLGANRTLVLIDGKRLPVDVSIGAVNINNIPLAIIDRIEIVSGGQSAIYGADAVGGVVNIITRKDFVGNEVSVGALIPENGGGEHREISLASGVKPTDNLSLALTLGYKTTTEIMRKNRDLINGVYPRDFTAINPPVGEYSWRAISPTRGPWQPSPNCPEDRRRATVPEQPENVYCAGTRDDTQSWMTPRSQEWYLTARADWDISSTSRLSSIFLFSENRSQHNLGNYMIAMNHPFTNLGPIVSRDRAIELGMTDLPDGANFIELYARSWDFEDRWNNNIDQSYGGTVQLETLLGEWDFSTSFSSFRSTNRREFLNVINKQKEIDLLYATPEGNIRINPDYIPFDPQRDPNLINTIHDDLVSKEFTDSFFIDLIASREIFDLPAGPVVLALGVNYQTEYYKQTPAQLDLLQYEEADGEGNMVPIAPLYEGTASTFGRGGREVHSVSAEVLAPVLPGVEVDAAVRFDQYSDFGSTMNYAFGTIWRATNFLAIRGASSSSYKAPNLNMIHSRSGGGYTSFRDDLYCQRERERNNVCEPGGGQQLYVDRPGNRDLNEEVGRSYNIGFVFEPVPQFSLMSDYYGFFVKDRHGLDRVQQIADDFYEGLGTDIGPGQSRIGSNIITWEVDEVGGEEQRIITKIATPWTNLGSIQTYVIDTKANLNLAFGNFRFNYDGSLFRFMSYKTQNYNDTPLRQTVGFKGLPRWRMRNDWNLGYNNTHFVNLGAHTIAQQAQDPEFTTPTREYYKIGEYTEWDASYRWRHGWQGDVILGVSNIFDTIGGKDTSANVLGAQSVNSSLYSIRGRTFFAKVTQRF